MAAGPRPESCKALFFLLEEASVVRFNRSVEFLRGNEAREDQGALPLSVSGSLVFGLDLSQEHLRFGSIESLLLFNESVTTTIRVFFIAISSFYPRMVVRSPPGDPGNPGDPASC